MSIKPYLLLPLLLLWLVVICESEARSLRVADHQLQNSTNKENDPKMKSTAAATRQTPVNESHSASNTHAKSKMENPRKHFRASEGESVVVSWRVRHSERDHYSHEKNPEFMEDYSRPRTHPPAHN